MTKTIRRALIAGGVVAAVGIGGAAYVQASGDDDRKATGAAAEKATAAALKSTGGGTVKLVEHDGDGWSVEVTKGAKTIEVDLDKAYKVVAEDDEGKDDEGKDDEGKDDDDRAVTGRTADKAKAAALKSTGGGTVRLVERDDDGWSVEVAKGGKTIEVALDKAYKVVAEEEDSQTGDADEHANGTKDAEGDKRAKSAKDDDKP